VSTRTSEPASAPTTTDLRLATAFRTVAIAEAFTWAGLLAGMLWAYVLTDPSDRIGIEVFGPIHGAMFVAYCVLALVCWRRFGWSLRATAVALVASIPPFTTVWFELSATRRGMLPRRARTA